jgi:cytochrome oxidase Cu insertion factor (SCO1/SenC/PrrC family)/cytochrome c2
VWKTALAFALAAMIGAGTAVLLTHRAAFSPGEANAAANLIDDAKLSKSRSPWDQEFFPNDSVATHDGRTLRFYEDLIRDKIVVVNFIYTSCSNICPLVTARLSQVKDLLGDRVGRDIFFVSITIDPLTDGPEILKKYAETYNAGPGWTFITGQPENIDRILFKLGQRSKVKAEHRNDVIIGNDRTGTWGRDSAFSDLNVLADTIQSFDPQWRKLSRREPLTESISEAKYELHNKPGTILFAKACAGCHSIGHGDVIGPDLAGVLIRRDPQWLRRFLREPDTLRREKDPVATLLDEQYPGARMPNLGLSNTDIDDLFAYFRTHKSNELATSSTRSTLTRSANPP